MSTLQSNRKEKMQRALSCLFIAVEPEVAESVKHDVESYVEELERTNEVLKRTLSRIDEWEIPKESGRFWDEPENTQPMSYASAFGSNGEREYIRSMARSALLITE